MPAKNEESKFISRLGENIRRLRLKAGITQKDLAYKCDFETPNMRRIESGNTNPTIKTLYKIAKALNLEIKQLMDFDSE